MIELLMEFILALLVTFWIATIAYKEGRESAEADGVLELLALADDLQRSRKACHISNCEVHDLRFEVTLYKPKSMAYDTCVGLWATDQPDLIKHHAKRERFFRIGYPEERL